MSALDAVRASLPRSAGRRSPPSGLYWGSLAVGLTPHRGADSPWQLTEAEFAESSFPTFAFGVGYVMDRALALYVASRADRLRILPLEDVSSGVWVDQAKRDGYTVYYVHAGGVTNFRSSDCGSIIVTHYVPPKNYRCMWATYYAKEVRPRGARISCARASLPGRRRGGL